MSALSLMTFLQFDIDPYDVADRASITLTLVLTAVAYKLVTASMLPAISYLTLLDKFISMCIMHRPQGCTQRPAVHEGCLINCLPLPGKWAAESSR